MTRHATSGFTRSAVLILAASTVAAFLGGISLATLGDASGMSVLAARPLAAAQTAAGLSLCAAMLAIPALRAIGRLWVRREVRVTREAVEIQRHTPLGIRHERVPLSTYLGIAHHVRASLSGLTHEIVLVHPNGDHHVTLLAGEQVTQSLLDAYKSLLGLPEVSARAIYERAGQALTPAMSTEFLAARA